MSSSFQHLGLSMVGDVALVEILTRDLQGPKAGQELGEELALVLAQEWARRILVDFRRTHFLSSSGFAALFKLVGRAGSDGRLVKFCNMAPELLIGAEVVGLPRVVEFHETQAAALKSFAAAGAASA